MQDMTVDGCTYETDTLGFLVRAEDWTEEFAVATAPLVGITDGLTERHWRVIRYLRGEYARTGRCALLYFACSKNGLRLAELQRLFPTGFLRGACRLAGITYREGYISNPCHASSTEGCSVEEEKIYRIDIRGFLVDPGQWDRSYAMHRAEELDLPQGLTDAHWRVLGHLRSEYATTGRVPTVYSVCETLDLTLDELARLFPTGYHRGAVKLAGLRVL